MQEEIFGPVLAVCKAKNFDDAMNIANNTIYGLTGAIYSKDKKKWERAQREFHVGNLYYNRKCTGAMVGRSPIRWLQHERYLLKSRWTRLPWPVHAGEAYQREEV